MKRILLTLAAAVTVITACGQNTKKMKTLVAYFSATGTTEAVAKDIAGVTGATLYEIKPEVRYTAADLDWRDKTVVFFATSGGSTIDKANKDFAAAYPKINWKAGKTLNGASQAEIKRWVEGLK